MTKPSETFVMRKKDTNLYVFESFDFRNDLSSITLAEFNDTGGCNHIHAKVFTDKKINELDDHLRELVEKRLASGDYIKEYVKMKINGDIIFL